MAIDKSLYAAPVGISQLAEDEAPLEIEIEDPESVTLNVGGMEIVLEPGADREDDGDFNANLADLMDDGDLDRKSTRLNSSH